MTSVFISYSRRDKAIAQVIAAELRNRGAEVFIDYQELVAGESFIGRLGREIEKRDCIVFLVSPRSVDSKWVQAEIAWGFTKGKTVIPALLEPATMVDFFFLINVEQVDFTRWSVDGDVRAAIRKLAGALKLPLEPVKSDPVPEIVSTSTIEPPKDTAVDVIPTFATGDLSDMFTTAANIAEDDPEQALFLYRQVLQIDPEYMRGQARAFIEREEENLMPKRIERMLMNAYAAVKLGEWERAQHIAEDILSLDESHDEASEIIELCEQSLECEPLYQQAVIAASKGRWNAAARLLKDVRENCEQYGDPADLYRHQAIRTQIFMLLPENTRSLERQQILIGHTNSVYSVAFSPDSKTLASGSFDNNVRLWSLKTFEELAILRGHKNYVYSVDFSPNGNLLASASGDQTVRLWDMANLKETGVLNGHKAAVVSAVFSPNGKLIASSSFDNTVRLWDAGNYKELAVLKGHSKTVFSVAFSPDSSRIVSTSSDQTVRIWDVKSQTELVTFTGHTGAVNSAVFSPNGLFLAMTSDDKTASLWDVNSRTLLRSLVGHHEWVRTSAFSPDGNLLITSSGDKTVRVWNTATYAPIVVLQHEAQVRTAAFSPDGTLIASAGDDKMITLWGLPE